MTPLSSKPSGTIPEPNFLTAALRSWLVNHLLSQEDLEELVYLLLELGYEEASLPEASEQLRGFLKREMSRMASESTSSSLQRLIRLCEGIVQFYLLRQSRETPALNQLNLFLPPGLSFSPVTGHLLFEPEDYYQPHNLFVQEQASWILSQGAFPETALRPEAPGNGGPNGHKPPEPEDSSVEAIPEAVTEAMTSDPEIVPQSPQQAPEEPPEAIQQSPAQAQPATESLPGSPPSRSSEFRSIRQRRLQLLKNMGE